MPATPDNQPAVRLPRRDGAARDGPARDGPARDGPPRPDSPGPDSSANRDTVRLPRQVPRRPGGGPARRPARRAPLALAAVVTTTWGALVSFAPMLLVVGLIHVIDGSGASVDRIARLGLAAWLLAHGVPLQTGIGTIGLAPLALTALAAWRVARAGVHTARAIGARRSRMPWPALAAGAAVGGVYGGLGALAALAASGSLVDVSAIRAGLGLAAFGLIAAGAGALAEAGVYGRLAARIPMPVRDGVRTGAVAGLLVLGAGAALAGTAVAINGGEASQIFDDYRTGFIGQAGLLLVCLFYAPNVATWAASYLVGPGFVVGAGTSVSAAHVTLGPLPAVPVLAGLPSGPLPDGGALLLGVPLAAAFTAGWLLARRRLHAPERGGASWGGLLGAAAIAGPVAGGLLAVASAAAGGPLGDGRLAQVGPHTGRVALTAVVVIVVGVALAAAATKVLIGVRAKD